MSLRHYLAAAVLVCSAANAQSPPVTLESLYSEMTDLSRLARLPEPGYTTKQFSSYDRRATDPTVLTDENWFANGDRGHFLREETRDGATEYVLMDAAGPGAMVRFWSANPDDAGTLRVYLDGADEPTMEVALTDYLGGKGILAPEPISGARALGWNSYLPVPYAEHCKVTASKPDFYYIIDYRSYDAGTEVETLSKESNFAQRDRARLVANTLRRPSGLVTPGSEAGTPQMLNGNVPDGGRSIELATFEGPAAIYALAGRLECTEAEVTLRGTLIEITFDGADTPQVLAPLSDFFGSGLGLNPYESLTSGVPAEEVVYSKWLMPFEQSARIRLINHSNHGLITSFTALVAPWDWDDRSLHFHAKWRGATDIATLPRQDWNVLEATGQGRYVGTVLHITNPSLSWWGEGDEKIYVDGEDFPSWFGTGTEDYFGYAWSNPVLFTHAYHAQPRVDGPRNFGHTVNSRYHILDDIPFSESIRFDMEIWHWADCEISQSTTAYWYARPGGTDTFPVPTAADLAVPEAKEPELPRVEGVLEGEKLRVVSVTGGVHEPQYSDAWGWSAYQQRWWMDAAVGDRLTLAFPVAKAGSYEVRAVFTRANDYAIVQPYINDTKAGDPLDFYNETVEATEETLLGVFDLKAGNNTFAAEITGANAAAIDRHMFGLDYLRLVPVDE